jgi:hypothetical protein
LGIGDWELGVELLDFTNTDDLEAWFNQNQE